MNKFKY